MQTSVASALVPTVARNNDAANALLIDAFPASTYNLLPEWEETLGLPDPCAGEQPTIEQRRAQVVARLVDVGGQSVSYFIALAATLGYAITITEFSPFRFGMSFGLPLCGDDWAHAWLVNAPDFTVRYFQFGVSSMGEPFASWGNTVLQCEFERLKPAHTVLNFNYS